MPELSIRPASLADAEALAPRLRREDIVELNAFGLGLTPAEGLIASLRASEEAYAVEAQGQVVCLFGVSAFDGGNPWLLASADLARHRRALMRIPPGYIDGWLKKYGFLWNYVHADCRTSVHWLRRLGFHIDPEHLRGGAPFHRFWMS